jgi:hypothetical protein
LIASARSRTSPTVTDDICFDVAINDCLPRIGLILLALLLCSRLIEFGCIEPSFRAGAISAQGFRPELVANGGQSIDVDFRAGDRPETPATSFVAEIFAV